MIGVIAGDIAGSRFEFNNFKSKKFRLYHKRCRPTDDSVMSLAAAKAILDCDKDCNVLSDYAVRNMQELGRIYKNAGYGGTFFKWIWASHPHPYNSFGNGAAMRISPCGYAADSLEEAKALSAAVTRISHDHPEGMKGAEAVATVIYLARTGSSREEIRKYIEDNYYRLDFTIDEIRPHYQFDVTCQGSVPVALEAFLESTDFEDAIRLAVSAGGDSDTIGAMTGSVAEAYYGVPEDIIETVIDYLDAHQMEILYYFEKRYPSKAISPDAENQTVFDILDRSVDKIIPAGTQIIVNGIDPDGSCHGFVEREQMIPDFSSFDQKA